MDKVPAYKMVAAMLTCALLTTLTVVDAQDKPVDHEAKTQSDIARERGQACEGLKGQAMQECLDNYVGPTRDAASDSDQRAPDSGRNANAGDGTKAQDAADGKKANASGDKKAQDAAEAGENGAANVDMTKSNKRGPVGPVRDGPQDQKR